MYPAPPNNSKQKAVASFIVILAVVLVTVGVNAYNAHQKPTTATAPTSTQPSTDSSASTTADTGSTSSFKDGTYTADSQYYVPQGYEDIKVTLTIKNGVVTDSQIVNSEGDRDSQAYQEAFASLYKSNVVGKSISGLQLSYIAGASDTTQAFNDALNQIRNEAQG